MTTYKKSIVNLPIGKPPNTSIHETTLKLCRLVQPIGVRNARVVAVVHNKRRIISVGIASAKTHPLQKKFSVYPHIHAEIDAIAMASRVADLSKCHLYIVRLKPGGRFGNACPCDSCKTAILSYQLKSVCWTLEQSALESSPERQTDPLRQAEADEVASRKREGNVK